MSDNDTSSFYFLQDDVCSPVRLGDSLGKVVESYGYGEFGIDLYDNQSQYHSFGYTGYERDTVAGTYYAQAREYQPLTGRFAARDVLKGSVDDLLSMNEYLYCRNAPEDYVDWDGQAAISIAAVLAVAKMIGGGALLGAGIDAALQYVTTGTIDKKEVAISGVTGAVASLIPVAGAAAGGKVAQIGGSQVVQKIATIATEATLNSAVAGTSSYALNRSINPEMGAEEIKDEVLVSVGIAGVVSLVSIGLNTTVGERLTQNLRHSERSFSYTKLFLHSVYDPNDPLWSLRPQFHKEARERVMRDMLQNRVFSGIVDTNSEWWNHVLVQETTKIWKMKKSKKEEEKCLEDQ